MLLYGAPALFMILFAGSLGLPLPSALATSVAGSLVAQGQLSAPTALVFATVGSVLGDLVGYGVGRVVGCELIDRYGKWVGLTRSQVARSERLFERWGGWGLLLSRTVLSALSSPVNLLAGASRYRVAPFLVYDLVGRLTWTMFYLAVGYGFSRNASLVADLLDNVWKLLASLVVAAASAYGLYRLQRSSARRS